MLLNLPAKFNFVHMSSKYKVYDNQMPQFITCTVVGWVDALSRESYKQIVCDSLLYCQKEKGLVLHAWVIMSNHIHLIVSAAEGHKVSDLARDFKKFTAKEIISAIENNVQESRRGWMLNIFRFAGENNNSNKENQFWQQDYHPVSLDTREKMQQRLNYLHENPVSAGLVWRAQDYKYSSAIDYYEDKAGLLPVISLHI